MFEYRALLENAGNSSSSLQDPLPETEDSRGNESKPKKPKGSSSSKGSRPSNKSKDKGQKGNNANKKSQSQESQKEKNAKNKNKNKKQAQKSKPTRGILHGLSSLKRDGNVAVIRQGDKVRVVRANFLLGPVSLEILPKVRKSQTIFCWLNKLFWKVKCASYQDSIMEWVQLLKC